MLFVFGHAVVDAEQEQRLLHAAFSIKNMWLLLFIYTVGCKNVALYFCPYLHLAQNRPLWRLMSTFGATHS